MLRIRFALFSVLILTLACTTNPRSSDLGTNTGKAEITTLKFSPTSAVLSPAAKSKLELLATHLRARQTGTENSPTMTIVAWSDHAYQNDPRAPASISDRQLAGLRLKAIEDYFKDLVTPANIQSFNMAERPSEVSRVLSTTDARMKAALAGSTENISTAVVSLSTR